MWANEKATADRCPTLTFEERKATPEGERCEEWNDSSPWMWSVQIPLQHREFSLEHGKRYVISVWACDAIANCQMR